MITQHALQRTMERTGRDEKSAADFIENAIRYGLWTKELPPAQQEYLATKLRPDNMAIVYSRHIFVLADNGTVVPMFEAPTWFGNTRKQRRPKLRSNEPVRNIRKWRRMNGMR